MCVHQLPDLLEADERAPTCCVVSTCRVVNCTAPYEPLPTDPETPLGFVDTTIISGSLESGWGLNAWAGKNGTGVQIGNAITQELAATVRHHNVTTDAACFTFDIDKVTCATLCCSALLVHCYLHSLQLQVAIAWHMQPVARRPDGHCVQCSQDQLQLLLSGFPS